MKKIVTAAIVALSASITLAGTATASPDTITQSEVCLALDRVPNILLVGMAIQKNTGVTYEEVGSFIAESVINTCPEYLPLLEDFIVKYG